jgi:hypothetical protein
LRSLRSFAATLARINQSGVALNGANYLFGNTGALSDIFRLIGMRMTLLAVTLITVAAAWPALAGEESPIISPQIGTNNSPKDVEASKLQGAATTTKDIQARELRILYFGEPWSNGKPLIDDATGYRVQIVGGCVVTEAFVAEIDAYNKTMREWHAKTGEARSGLSQTQFEQALRNISTAPDYVLVTVVDANTGTQQATCMEAETLLSALQVEHALQWDRAVAFALAQPDRLFRFSNPGALKLVSRAYSDPVLGEAREFLAAMTLAQIDVATRDPDSKFYKFCAREPGAFGARFPALAHVLSKRGVLCTSSCKPGLFHIDIRPPNKPAAPAREPGGALPSR